MHVHMSGRLDLEPSVLDMIYYTNFRLTETPF